MRAYTDISNTKLYYLYDGDEPLVTETFSGNRAIVQSIYGYAGDGLRQLDFGGGYHSEEAYDPQGSYVEHTSDNTWSEFSEAALDTAVYDSYGDERADIQTGSGDPQQRNQPFYFGGQWGYYTDDATNLVLMTNRYYDPGVGRFVTRDPAGYAGGENLYGFVGNNPVNDIDPSGLADTGAKSGWEFFKGELFGLADTAWSLGPGMGIQPLLPGKYRSFQPSSLSDTKEDERNGVTFGNVLGTVGSFFTPAGLETGAPRAVGMFRRVANTGAFSDLGALMTKQNVLRVAARAGVSLNGVKIQIVRDPGLLSKPFAGWTNGKIIQLYPNAFRSTEELVKTLAHEAEHVSQIRTFGRATDTAISAEYEKDAEQAEEIAWKIFNSR